jgi:hypothetical protein
MRSSSSYRFLSVLIISAVVLGLAGVAAAQERVTRESVDQLTASWPATPREVAAKMIAKYGLPHEATASMLMWHDNGPWKHTIVFRDEVPHDFPKPHTDLLEQVVDYKVPPGKFDELAEYDGSVIVERTKGELSARCDKEEMNILALNLADDIVKGRRTVAESREFYAKTATAAMQGEKPPYIQALRFSSQVASADRDRPFAPQAMISSSPANDNGTQEDGTRNRMRKD